MNSRERRRITNALVALQVENREEIDLPRAAAMEIHAERLLSAICRIYNDLYDAGRNAGVMAIRIPPRNRVRPTREKGEPIA
jgi:hypothetical protein